MKQDTDPLGSDKKEDISQGKNEPKKSTEEKKENIAPSTTAQPSPKDDAVLPETDTEDESFLEKVLKHGKPILAGAVLLCFLFALALVKIFPPKNTAEKVPVEITAGMSSREIGRILEDKGIIGSRYVFWLAAKLSHKENQFKAGSYLFFPGTPHKEALDILIEGQNNLVRFTIPEGFTIRDMAKRLEKEGVVKAKDFLKEAKDFAPYPYMEKREGIIYRAEGFLFPDTYTVTPGASPKEILTMMAETFDHRLTEEMREKAEANNLSVFELVTLASLVEKEARYEEDRPIIAQVFLKRLEINMPLQSDATLQYLMDAPKEDVSIEDTKAEHAYNSYQNYGLPPGPIASPGLDAINAVLNPADTEYLYFVADREGHNHFSLSYSEHLDIVDKVR